MGVEIVRQVGMERVRQKCENPLHLLIGFNKENGKSKLD